jgi:hypothetical protein
VTESPSATSTPVSDPDDHRSPSIDWIGFCAWPVVFMFNLIIPLIFGLDMTPERGRIGIGMGCLSLLTAGWLLCCYSPATLRQIILGGVVVACTQVYPILQLIAGMLALAGAELMGLSVNGDDAGIEYIVSETGGFVVTVLVGAELIAFSLFIGMLISLFLPPEWFGWTRAEGEGDPVV